MQNNVLDIEKTKLIVNINEYYKEINRFLKDVDDLIKTKQIQLIGEKINSNDYLLSNKDQRESAIFTQIYDDFSFHGYNGDVLQYLIFEYKIKTENSLNIPNLTVQEHIKTMFNSRDLNDELKSTLNIKDNSNKKVKL